MRLTRLAVPLALTALWACTPEEPSSAPDAGGDMTVAPGDEGVLLDAGGPRPQGDGLAGFGDLCGGFDDVNCADGLVCYFEGCGTDSVGYCVPLPPECPSASNATPVCGCSGVTYPSDCARLRSSWGDPLNHEGACRVEAGPPVGTDAGPVDAAVADGSNRGPPDSAHPPSDGATDAGQRSDGAATDLDAMAGPPSDAAVDPVHRDASAADSSPELPDEGIRPPDAAVSPPEAQRLAEAVCAAAYECTGPDACCVGDRPFLVAHEGCCNLYEISYDVCVEVMAFSIIENRVRCENAGADDTWCDAEQECLSWVGARLVCGVYVGRRVLRLPASCSPFGLNDCEEGC